MSEALPFRAAAGHMPSRCQRGASTLRASMNEVAICEKRRAEASEVGQLAATLVH